MQGMNNINFHKKNYHPEIGDFKTHASTCGSHILIEG
jgi:hypothetical protein